MAELCFTCGPRRLPWISLLICTSAALSFAFACALPFAAFAALAALTLRRSDALVVMAAIFGLNQMSGFIFHHYPLTAPTFGWGAALGLAALASAFAAQGAAARLAKRPRVAALAALLAAFAAYEGVIFAISAALGSRLADYAPAIVVRIFAINAASFAALILIHHLTRIIHTRRETTLPFAFPLLERNGPTDEAAAGKARMS